MKKSKAQAEKNLSPRDRIVNTAMRLFYGHGIKATGVDTLIAQSGIAKMTFYKHFPSKHDLVMEFLKRRDSEWLAWFRHRLEAQGKRGKEKLLAVFDVMEEWFSEPNFRGCAFLNTVAEMRDAKTEEHQCAVLHKKTLAKDLEKIVEEAGLPDSKKISQELLLLIEGAIVSAQLQGNPKPARTAKMIAEQMIKNY
jgi:AcrR family transcriptional regulator